MRSVTPSPTSIKSPMKTGVGITDPRRTGVAPGRARTVPLEERRSWARMLHPEVVSMRWERDTM